MPLNQIDKTTEDEDSPNGYTRQHFIISHWLCCSTKKYYYLPPHSSTLHCDSAASQERPMTGSVDGYSDPLESIVVSHSNGLIIIKVSLTYPYPYLETQLGTYNNTLNYTLKYSNSLEVVDECLSGEQQPQWVDMAPPLHHLTISGSVFNTWKNVRGALRTCLELSQELVSTIIWLLSHSQSEVSTKEPPSRRIAPLFIHCYLSEQYNCVYIVSGLSFSRVLVLFRFLFITFSFSILHCILTYPHEYIVLSSSTWS